MRMTVNEEGQMVLSELYVGIIIQTDRGEYSICQRDDAIEITLPNGAYLDSDAVKRLED